MSASHNPGGPTEDFGIKFNYNSGEPAPEKITDKIYDVTKSISTLKMADIPDIDLSKVLPVLLTHMCRCCHAHTRNTHYQVGVTSFGDFEVEVIDPVADYLAQLKEVFDFDLLRGFVSRSDFRMVYDALHAITGVYAKPILVDELGAPEDALRCV